MIRICLRSIVAGALLVGVLASLPSQWAAAQPRPERALAGRSPAPRSRRRRSRRTPAMQISWEVRNRFRLFREERDFLLHTESARGRSVLASEQALELQSDGRGWARNTVNRLCIDLSGRVSEPCTRDNVKESYLTPTDHPITVRLTGAGSGWRHLRLVVRRRRRSASIDLRLRRAGQSAGALWPHHGCHRGRLLRPRGAAARLYRDHGARSFHRRSRRQHRLRRRQSGPRDRARRRGFLLPLLSRHARARSTTVRAAPASRADGPAKRRTRCRTGSATARCGSIPPATARCTAIRPAPRWRSRFDIRTSR